MATIIDGKALAAELKAEIRDVAARLPCQPGLAVVLLGDDPASRKYMAGKERDCRECGFRSMEHRLPADTTEAALLDLIRQLNGDDDVDGILIQLPLPRHIRHWAVLDAVSPEKDVDGFHPVNVGRLASGDPLFVPCTPAAVMEILKKYGISPAGQRCVVVGRSDIVGKPMARLLLMADGTVTVCHSKTPDLGAVTREADILVTAAGRPGLVTGDMVKEGAVVIDVSTNWTPEGVWRGDVVFDDAAERASYITPVPGGVGPVTRAVLLKNLLQAAERRTQA
ncbi:MAG: bifunctional 5,10-methylenetetrahydrofolate dehydrogenase/5,10-methenyltetrahydrofolate cyclohydrolase [Dysosmobacter sp.]|nr:bifunctional 5,10-methylenetetrahydrofolate dehydrogenase/5,10-methenyltetrahydrofolate cyclohydrolase [Dysosmobacter sp.]